MIRLRGKHLSYILHYLHLATFIKHSIGMVSIQQCKTRVIVVALSACSAPLMFASGDSPFTLQCNQEPAVGHSSQAMRYCWAQCLD